MSDSGSNSCVLDLAGALRNGCATTIPKCGVLRLPRLSTWSLAIRDGVWSVDIAIAFRGNPVGCRLAPSECYHNTCLLAPLDLVVTPIWSKDEHAMLFCRRSVLPNNLGFEAIVASHACRLQREQGPLMRRELGRDLQWRCMKRSFRLRSPAHLCEPNKVTVTSATARCCCHENCAGSHQPTTAK